MTSIEYLRYCCSQLLPIDYSNLLSTGEILDKLIMVCNQLITNQTEIVNNIAGNKAEINLIKGEIIGIKSQLVSIKTELQKIAEGEYMDVYIDALANWIDKNLQEIVAKIAKQVFFGLTNDGYFVAYIPESWSDIRFGTIMSCRDPNWGHLTLSY